jgi:thiol-disulfide isomerase/thioredoxin
MLSISLGPLALPLAPLLLWLAVWGTSWLATRLASKHHHQNQAGGAVVHAALLGLLTARLVHLGLNADLYAAAPWYAFDLRDGGWHASSGALAGAAWLTWRGWRVPALRRALGTAALVGTVSWLAATAALRSGPAQRLPAVAVVALDNGLPLDLAMAARGRPTVVNLWATWCGPCREEMPLLAAAQQRHPDIAFLFVNQGESASAVRAWLDRQRMPPREVLLDTGSALGPAVGSKGLPTTLFYNADGRQVDAHFGVLNAAALESRLRALREAQ